jgi:magnesium transporter
MDPGDRQESRALRPERRSRRLGRRRAPPPGSRPGAIVIPADAPPPVVSAFAFDAVHLREAKLDEIGGAASMLGAGIVWLDVSGFGDEAKLRRLGEIFGLHPLLLADVVNTGQRPKIDSFDDRHLIVVGQPHLAPTGEVSIEQISIVLGPGWVLSFQERPGDPFEPIRARLRSGVTSLRRNGPDYLAYALLDAIVDSYFPVLEQLGARIDELESAVVDRPDATSMVEFHVCRRSLLVLHRTLWQLRDALAAAAREQQALFTPPVRVYVRDTVDHVLQAVDMTEAWRELLVSLLELYQISLNNRLNEVIKALTVLASIFIPLTFIVGVYGMNFDVMPELRWRYGYPAVLGGMALLSIGLLLWFRRRGWIGGRQRRGAVTSTSAIATPPTATS